MSSVPLVRVVRSGLEESVHRGDVAVVNSAGELIAFAGDPQRRLNARSSMKPLQASVSLSLAGLEFGDREVAVMCASHNAETVHIEAVRSILARAGVQEDALRCPAMRPWDDESRDLAPTPLRINSDCSGKHAGMLAACRAQGWDVVTYRDPAHPLQEAVLRAVLNAASIGSVHVGVDGCGVPVHGLPLRSMATIYARLGSPEGLGDLGPHARRAADAMRAEPYMVAGRNRVDTAVMEAAEGVIVKAGAEGVMCAAVVRRGLGVAVKVRDGSARAPGVALIHTLRSVDAIDDGALSLVARFARPPVLGGGAPVGEIAPVFSLTLA